MSRSHAQTVAKTSPLFRSAVARGDAGEALVLGKRILFACQERVRELGLQATRGSLLDRIASAGEGARGEKVDTQEVAHYEAVAETVAVAMKHMGLRGIEERVHACEFGQERVEAAGEEPQELREVHASLERVSSLYEVVAGIVRQADPLIERFSANIDAARPRLEKASHEILVHYAGTSSGNQRSCACYVVILCFFAAAIALSVV